MKLSFFSFVFRAKKPSEISHFRKHFFPLLFLVLGISIIYSNSMKAAFHFDDAHIAIRTNLHLKDLSFESLKGTFYFTPNRQNIYRPLSCLTFGLNYYFGKDDPFGYHIVNITIHVLCSIAVYVFFHVLLSIPGVRPAFAQKNRYEISVIASFLFAFHPLQVNVATYIIQRMASMSAFFYIVSVTGYLIFRISTQSEQKNRQLKKVLALSLSVISGVFSVLSKENAAVLPIMILMIDYLFFYNISDVSQKWKLRRIYGIAVAVILILFVWAGTKPLLQSINGYEHRDFTIGERLLTQPRIVFFYIFLLIIPSVNLLNLNHDFPLSKSLLDPPQTVFSVFGIALLVILGMVLIRKLNLVSFAIWWFLGNLIIESTILPLELIFEHRTYLPGVMIFFLLSFSIAYIFFVVLKNKKWLIVVSFVFILFGNGTYIRNVIFRTPVSLWQDVVQKSPNYARAHSELGAIYMDYGNYKEAEKELNIALAIDPKMHTTLVNLGKIYLDKPGMIYKAIDLFKRAQVYNPHITTDGFMAMGDAYMRLKNYGKAEHFYEVVLNRFNFFGPAINNYGTAKMRQGKLEEAEKVFRKGIQLDPYNELYYLNLATIYFDERKFDDAQKILKRYLALNNKGKNTKALLKKMEKMISENTVNGR